MQSLRNEVYRIIVNPDQYKLRDSKITIEGKEIVLMLSIQQEIIPDTTFNEGIVVRVDIGEVIRGVCAINNSKKGHTLVDMVARKNCVH